MPYGGFPLKIHVSNGQRGKSIRSADGKTEVYYFGNHAETALLKFKAEIERPAFGRETAGATEVGRRL